MHGPDTAYYERVARWSATPAYRAEVDALEARLDLPAGARILDVGCGTGTAMRLLRGAGRRVTGIDRSPAWAACCAERPIARADATALPFGDDCFDAALLVHVVGHLETPAHALAEIGRVLRPGGRLGILTPNARFVRALRLNPGNTRRYIPDPTVERFFTLARLRRTLTAAGFRVRHALPWGHRPRLVPAAALRERLLLVATATTARSSRNTFRLPDTSQQRAAAHSPA